MRLGLVKFSASSVVSLAFALTACGSSSTSSGGSDAGKTSTGGSGANGGDGGSGGTGTGNEDAGGTGTTGTTGTSNNCGTVNCTATQYCVLDATTDAQGNTTWSPANMCTTIPSSCTLPAAGMDSTAFCSCLQMNDSSCPTSGVVMTECQGEDSEFQFGCSASE